jgi:hypothetical protein
VTYVADNVQRPGLATHAGISRTAGHRHGVDAGLLLLIGDGHGVAARMARPARSKPNGLTGIVELFSVPIARRPARSAPTHAAWLHIREARWLHVAR